MPCLATWQLYSISLTYFGGGLWLGGERPEAAAELLHSLPDALRINMKTTAPWHSPWTVSGRPLDGP